MGEDHPGILFGSWSCAVCVPQLTHTSFSQALDRIMIDEAHSGMLLRGGRNLTRAVLSQDLCRILIDGAHVGMLLLGGRTLARVLFSQALDL